MRCYRPLMTNSDHANFAAAGIPAFRLVAGFDEPNAALRFVLTEADTREKVATSELVSAAQLAACITAAACRAEAVAAGVLARGGFVATPARWCAAQAKRYCLLAVHRPMHPSDCRNDPEPLRPDRRPVVTLVMPFEPPVA